VVVLYWAHLISLGPAVILAVLISGVVVGVGLWFEVKFYKELRREVLYHWDKQERYINSLDLLDRRIAFA
jgi:hypothetical protein